MANRLNRDEIVQRLRELRGEIETEIGRLLKEERILFHYTVDRSRVFFEAEVKKLHRRYRVNSLRYVFNAPIKHILSAPLIYSMFLPLLLLDLAMSFYQAICFSIYGIPQVKRSDYVVIDRHQLSYLNAIEKFNCIFCGYGNGVLGYAREITARTEQHWCPIKHARQTAAPHDREQKFASYGDADGYREQLKALRREWQQDETDSSNSTGDRS